MATPSFQTSTADSPQLSPSRAVHRETEWPPVSTSSRKRITQPLGAFLHSPCVRVRLPFARSLRTRCAQELAGATLGVIWYLRAAGNYAMATTRSKSLSKFRASSLAHADIESVDHSTKMTLHKYPGNSAASSITLFIDDLPLLVWLAVRYDPFFVRRRSFCLSPASARSLRSNAQPIRLPTRCPFTLPKCLGQLGQDCHRLQSINGLGDFL